MEPVVEYDSGRRSLKFVFPTGGAYTFEDVPQHPDGFAEFAQLVGEVDRWLSGLSSSDRKGFQKRVLTQSNEGFYAVRFEMLVLQVLRRLGDVELADTRDGGGPDFLVHPIGGGPDFYVEATLALFQESPEFRRVKCWLCESLQAFPYHINVDIDPIEGLSEFIRNSANQQRLADPIARFLSSGLTEFEIDLDGFEFWVYARPSSVGVSVNVGEGRGHLVSEMSNNISWLEGKFRDKDKQRRKWLKKSGWKGREPLYFIALGPDFSKMNQWTYEDDVKRILGVTRPQEEAVCFSEISGVLTLVNSAMGNPVGSVKVIPNKGVDVPVPLKPFLEWMSLQDIVSGEWG